MADLKLKKGPIWIVGFLSILSVILGGFLAAMENVILAGLQSLVWIIGIGLGANVLFALQRSMFYRDELAKKDECAGTDGNK
jgi:hypothetical protein